MIHWWIADYFFWVLPVLDLVLLCFTFAWWKTRNSKVGWCALGMLGLIITAVVLKLFVVTDRVQLVRNVESMRDLVNAGKLDEALQHFDDEVELDAGGSKTKQQRATLNAIARINMANYQVKKLALNGIKVEEVARPNATVAFFVDVEEGDQSLLCTMGFALSPDGQWRVRSVAMRTRWGGHAVPVRFPF